MTKYLKTASPISGYYDRAGNILIRRGEIIPIVDDKRLTDATKARIRKGGLLWTTKEEYDAQFPAVSAVQEVAGTVATYETIESTGAINFPSDNVAVAIMDTEEVALVEDTQIETKKSRGRPKKS